MNAWEDQVRSDLYCCDPRTLDEISERMNWKAILAIYARCGFNDACDVLADEYEAAVTQLAEEREAQCDDDPDNLELMLDNRERARAIAEAF